MQPPASSSMLQLSCLKIITYLLCSMLMSVRSLSPYFVTTLTDCKTGSAVLTVSSPTTSGGIDTTTTTITYPTAFLGAPTLALGLRYLSSTYTTTVASDYTWIMDVSVSTTGSSTAILRCNRTSGVISQISVNYLAIYNSQII